MLGADTAHCRHEYELGTTRSTCMQDEARVFSRCETSGFHERVRMRDLGLRTKSIRCPGLYELLWQRRYTDTRQEENANQS